MLIDKMPSTSRNNKKKQSEADFEVQRCFRDGCSTPIMEAIQDRIPPQLFRNLLENFTDYGFLNQRDPLTNCTPLLFLSCLDDFPQAVALAAILLEPKYGVDIHVSSGPGAYHAIFAAAELKHTPMVKLLIEHGGDIMNSSNRPDGPPSTPINIASQNNCIEITAMIVNAGKNQGKLNDMWKSRNALHQTASTQSMLLGQSQIIGIMAKAGADLRNSFHTVWGIKYDEFDRTDYFDPDPALHPEQWALYKTVYSYVTNTCCCCRESPISDKSLKVCSRCNMASYCGSTCQKEDWKVHKRCCKHLNEGMDMVRFQSNDEHELRQTGFREAYIPSLNEYDHSDDEDVAAAVWEYHATEAIAGTDIVKRVWKRYPPLVERNLESLLRLGSPRYMYRPNDSDCDGVHFPAPYPPEPDDRVSTRYVYFTVMMEFDVYTGAARAVRREGSIHAPKRYSSRTDGFIPR